MSAIPLFPCTTLAETLKFYQAVGFEIAYQQDDPYLYAAVYQGDVTLHFSRLSVYGGKNGFGAALVYVPEVHVTHRAFADGLRTAYGKVPTVGSPRITRLLPSHTRFRLFDPTGNILTYINHDEPDADFSAYVVPASPLLQALDNAIFLRDTYANDPAAAKVLDKALAKEKGELLDRARVLAARAELAVALGETSRAEALQGELQRLKLSEEERTNWAEELEAANRLERWIKGNW